MSSTASRLSSAILGKLKQGGKVKVPNYDRSKLQPGIIHVGVGNFHRSHMATYFDDLFGMGKGHEFGIVGAGLMSFDEKKRAVMEEQDWLDTLVERDDGVANARIVGSMMDYLPIDEQNHAPLKQALLSPTLHIVSLTVTEGGYYLNADGRFDENNPKIIQDAENPNQPKTMPGMVVQALQKRKEAGLAPFTVMSCDNVPHNGDVGKEAVLGMAKVLDPHFADWIGENVAFPNSMVDRITPATSDMERQFVEEKFGYKDAWPVFCEPFRQWVLEDDFSKGAKRPPLEFVGAEFVDNVTPFEQMKIRILNGGHASLCYPAALLGLTYVHDAMAHPVLSKFLDALERHELVPSVGPVPDTDTSKYWSDIIQSRFQNPEMNDAIPRICYDGANRQPKFIIPPAGDALKAGRPIDGLALVSAMWCRYCQGVTEAGEEIPSSTDPQWDRLHAIALEAKNDPKKWLLELDDIYGSVGRNEAFQSSFASALKSIETNGAEGAMMEYIQKVDG